MALDYLCTNLLYLQVKEIFFFYKGFMKEKIGIAPLKQSVISEIRILGSKINLVFYYADCLP